MSNFTTQPSATVRSAVLVISVALSTLCLGGVVIGLTWDASEQTVVAQHTTQSPV